ncbi:hypothetical protein KAM380_094720 [Aeromonas caviae]|nr:hypothetical protein KAM380_094720 [Aeromonas caviae]
MRATSPPETMEAAAEATVWLMLLSCNVHAGRPLLRPARPCHRVKPTSKAMIDMLNDQPIRRPAYTFEGVSRMPSATPVSTARGLSSRSMRTWGGAVEGAGLMAIPCRSGKRALHN